MIDTIEISVTRAAESKINKLDISNVPFGRVFTDHMFVADYADGNWQKAKILPYGKMEFFPSMSALHYGQTAFEGLKAFRDVDGSINLFRPLDNLGRLNISAERLCMPFVPENLFMEGLLTLLRIDKDWILDADGFSLYIRPVLFANDECIGVRVSDNYKLVIMCTVAGAYFREPIKVKIETVFARAFKGGTGFTKAAGNYGVSLYPTRLAQKQGYHQLIWTDSAEHKYIEESGMMNVMFVIDGKLVTPALESKTILDGKTRNSLLTIARDMGMTVEERKISVEELTGALEDGKLTEAFGAGTAATVAPIGVIGYNDKDYVLPEQKEAIGAKLLKELSDIRRGRKKDKYNWIVKV